MELTLGRRRRHKMTQINDENFQTVINATWSQQPSPRKRNRVSEMLNAFSGIVYLVNDHTWITDYVFWVLPLLTSRSDHNSFQLAPALGMLQVLSSYLWEERARESGRQASQKAAGRRGVPLRSQTHSINFPYLSPCISLASHALSISFRPPESRGVNKDAVREHQLLFSTKFPLRVTNSIIWTVSMTQGGLSVQPASYSWRWQVRTRYGLAGPRRGRVKTIYLK